MYWILFVMGTIVAVVAAVIAGGLASPRTHTASVSALIHAPIDEVWRTVRDVRAYAAWRPDVRSVSVDASDDGAEWTERGRQSVRFGVTVDEPPHRFGARILDDDVPYTGEWEWQLERVESGTRVTITERGEIGNVLVRFVATHMTGHDRAIGAYLAALSARCEQTNV